MTTTSLTSSTAEAAPARPAPPPPPPPASLDALTPVQMAEKAIAVGQAKARSRPASTLVLAVLAGAFIALGAMFATVTATSVPGEDGAAVLLPYGVTKTLMGVTFSVGLILVVVGGAELFTGNILLVMAWVSRRIRGRDVLRNWAIVYPGNLVGAVGIALLAFASGQYRSAGGQLGLTALTIAEGKGGLGFGQAVALGTLCNVLVCLAVWLSYSARTTTGRILAVVPPVAAFVAAGFEHSVANMYFLPVAVLIRYGAPASFWSSAGTTADAFPHVTWTAFVGNIVPVTLGNIAGGLLVGGAYWLVYRRRDALSMEDGDNGTD